MANEKKSIGIRPLAGYLLVEPLEVESKTASGIVLPETVSQEKQGQGTVLSIGEDMVMENGKVLKSPVKVSDKVVYRKWGGDEIKVGNKEYKLVKFDDLMAVIE